MQHTIKFLENVTNYDKCHIHGWMVMQSRFPNLVFQHFPVLKKYILVVILLDIY